MTIQVNKVDQPVKAKHAIARILQAEGVACFTCYPDNAIIDAVAELNIRPVLAVPNVSRSILPMALPVSKMAVRLG